MYKIQWNILELLFCLFTIIAQVLSLKNVRISGPEAVQVGDIVTLSCEYDLENNDLMAVYWDVNGEVFFKYLHNNKVLLLPQYNVDLNRSNANDIIFNSVTGIHSASYGCEVLLDAPTFDREIAFKSLLVVQKFKTGPIINLSGNPSLEYNQISFGDKFKATCESEYSHSLANFTWTINGFHYPSSNSVLHNVKRSEIIVNINNQVKNTSPYDSKIIVQCEMTITDLYRESAEVELFIVNDDFNNDDFDYSACNSLFFKLELLSIISYIMLMILNKYLITW